MTIEEKPKTKMFNIGWVGDGGRWWPVGGGGGTGGRDHERGRDPSAPPHTLTGQPGVANPC